MTTKWQSQGFVNTMHSRRPRVAFVITSLHVGGAETVLQNLIAKLHGRIEPQVFSLSDGGAISERLTHMGVPTFAFPVRPLRGLPTSYIRLRNALRSFNPDVVHTWLYHADFLGGMASHSAGPYPLVWGIHNSSMGADLPLTTQAIIRLLARLSPSLPTLIHSCSDVAARRHVRAGYPAHKIRVIPNGVDTGAFFPSVRSRAQIRAELNLRPGTPLVGHIGRFHRHKDHKSLIEAAAIVLRDFPDVHFVLAGLHIESGNHELQALIGERRLESRLHLLGQRDDISRLMASFDVYVSSSISEAFPVVLLEAMSSGVPCVATDVGDSAKILGNLGVVVPPADPLALANGIRSALALSSDERMVSSDRARQRIVDHFDWTHISTQFLKLYTDLASA